MIDCDFFPNEKFDLNGSIHVFNKNKHVHNSEHTRAVTVCGVQIFYNRPRMGKSHSKRHELVDFPLFTIASIGRYSRSHLGWYFRMLFQRSKLKAQTSPLTETWQKRLSSFELWAFENVTPSGIGCSQSSFITEITEYVYFSLIYSVCELQYKIE